MQYGRVTGRFLAAVADGTADLDENPDEVPLRGKVTFTPSAASLKVAGQTATILPAPIDCLLDEEGYLSLNGVRGVNLIATDTEDTNPTGFTYRVSFSSLNYDGTPVSYGPFSIAVPAGQTIDLAIVAPVASANGAAIVRGARGERGFAGPAGPAALPPGARFGVTGDSIIDANDGQQDRNHNTTVQHIFTTRSGGRFVLVAQRGVSGQTTAEVLDRFDTDFLPGSVDIIMIRAGVNDVSKNVDPAETRANLMALADKARSIGAVPAFDTQTPVDYFTADQSAAQMRLNRWLLDWCAQNGIRCANSWAPAVDWSGPRWIDPSYTMDGIHPVAKGQSLIADAWLKVFADVPLRAPRTALSAGEPINILGTENPLMLNAADGAVADGWAGAVPASGAKSLVFRDGTAGRMQRMQLTAAPEGALIETKRDLFFDPGRFAADGDVLELSVAVNIEMAAIGAVRAYLQFFQWDGTPAEGISTLTVPVSGGVMTVRVPVRAADNGYVINAYMLAITGNVTAAMEVGAFNLVNLTRNGLD